MPIDSQKPIISLRPPQEAVLRSQLGLLFLLWRRQFGKSHTLGAVGLDWMMERICDVVYVSASLRLGLENVRKEAGIWRNAINELRKRVGPDAAKQIQTSADDDHGRLLDLDAVADLFEHQKLETKLYHSQANYSRSIVIAPNPDTAVGWTANGIFDEVGRMPEFQDLWEALEPIVSSNPQLKFRGATTPPPDDSHYSYELLAPAAGTEFSVNPRGNFYTSEAGIPCHRLDAWDAADGGVPIYDLKTREPLTPDESRAAAIDKTAWDRNYGVKFISGGSAAISLVDIMNAQEAGRNKTTAHNITDNLEAA